MRLKVLSLIMLLVLLLLLGTGVLAKEDNPFIVFFNIEEGQKFSSGVHPIVFALNGINLELELNGEPFKLGDEVTTQGYNTLIAKAVTSQGNQATTSINFYINKQPIQVGKLPIDYGYVGVVQEFLLSNYFIDLDRDGITYKVELSNKDILDYSITDGILTLTPLSLGTTELYLEVSDGKNKPLEIFHSFEIK